MPALKIAVAANNRVRIFIDSPARSGSAGAAVTGIVSAAPSSGSQLNSGSTRGSLDVYV